MSEKEEPNFEKLEQELNISPMDQDAIQMYELYKSLTKAGFKERAALYLVGLIVAETTTLDEGASLIEFHMDPEEDFDEDED